MKKQNKTYFPLNQLGIYKAFDKCVVFDDTYDTKYYIVVLFYCNRPFVNWHIVKDDYDAITLNYAVDCCVKYYNGLDLNARRNSKRMTKIAVERFAGDVVKVFR